jgi:hypothetical protein
MASQHPSMQKSGGLIYPELADPPSAMAGRRHA